ncbi:hypothetical protein L6R50_21385 [Myxococcota bacterium]|nr:hypothetical protein [Myxococcota bacterium]
MFVVSLSFDTRSGPEEKASRDARRREAALGLAAVLAPLAADLLPKLIQPGGMLGEDFRFSLLESDLAKLRADLEELRKPSESPTGPAPAVDDDDLHGDIGVAGPTHYASRRRAWSEGG